MDIDEQYNQLAFYTLSHKGKDFIHQHIVDAFAIQTANEHTKPIKIVYALIGIYLHVKKNYLGKEVQMAHISISKKSKVFPNIFLPEKRGEITIVDINNISNASDKDNQIHCWCKSIWEAFKSQQDLIKSIAKDLL